MISMQDQSEDGADHLSLVPMPKMPEPVKIRGDPDLGFVHDDHIDEDK